MKLIGVIYVLVMLFLIPSCGKKGPPEYKKQTIKYHYKI